MCWSFCCSRFFRHFMLIPPQLFIWLGCFLFVQNKFYYRVFICQWAWVAGTQHTEYYSIFFCAQRQLVVLETKLSTQRQIATCFWLNLIAKPIFPFILNVLHIKTTCDSVESMASIVDSSFKHFWCTLFWALCHAHSIRIENLILNDSLQSNRLAV